MQKKYFKIKLHKYYVVVFSNFDFVWISSEIRGPGFIMSSVKVVYHWVRFHLEPIRDVIKSTE